MGELKCQSLLPPEQPRIAPARRSSTDDRSKPRTAGALSLWDARSRRGNPTFRVGALVPQRQVP